MERQNDAPDRATEPLTVIFRCPPELEAVLPRPIPAVQGLPDWFKTMPQTVFSALLQSEQRTVKKCPPFIDAMTCGFLIPLVTEVRVENGQFSWEHEVPRGSLYASTHSPIDFHDNSQVAGSPFFEQDRVIIKFNGFWTIELPSGYSLLITHPFNRADLPFVTLTGLVDADRYRDNFINFPAHWRDAAFNGVLARGTPIAQCIPVKRDDWTVRCEALGSEATKRMNDLKLALAHDRDIYRRQFRAAKR